MPQISTKYFGILNYGENSVFYFPAGLPGFETEKYFIFIEQPVNKPIVFMQSLGSAELCFPTLPIFTIDPAYRLDLSHDDLAALEFTPDARPVVGADVLCLAIVSLSPDEAPTANLLSPVVANLGNRRAVQAIQPECPHSHRHPLFAPQEEVVCS